MMMSDCEDLVKMVYFEINLLIVDESQEKLAFNSANIKYNIQTKGSLVQSDTKIKDILAFQIFPKENTPQPNHKLTQMAVSKRV